MSNTIWVSLYFKRPYYNVLNTELRNKKLLASLYKTENHYLEDNFAFFGVNYCNDELIFDVKQLEIISEDCRKANIVDFLENSLKST
mgnify:CR=1 FL=1